MHFFIKHLCNLKSCDSDQNHLESGDKIFTTAPIGRKKLQTF